MSKYHYHDPRYHDLTPDEEDRLMQLCAKFKPRAVATRKYTEQGDWADHDKVADDFLLALRSIGFWIDADEIEKIVLLENFTLKPTLCWQTPKDQLARIRRLPPWER